MELKSLKKIKTKNRKRVGRGISAGQGKTAGRGTKGQNSRTGGGTRPGFEGGQMPLTQRIPKKRGFTARVPKSIAIDLSRLSVIKDGEKIDLQLLKKVGVIGKKVSLVKIVGNTEIKTKLKVSVPISKKAAAIVKKAGGSVE